MKKKNKESTSLSLSIIAIVISVIVAIFQIKLSRESNELAYNQHIMDNRPLFKPIDVSYELIDLHAYFFTFSYSFMTYPPPQITYRLAPMAVVRKNFTFVNTGNTSALYLAYFNLDYDVSDITFLRKRLIKEIKERHLYDGNTDSSRIEFTNGFLQTHIFENDTLRINIVDTLMNERAGKLLFDTSRVFISHMLILYENNERLYFDTFIMTKFRLNSPLLTVQYSPLITPSVINVKNTIEDYFVKDGHPVYNSNAYGRKESRYLKKLSKQINRIYEKHNEALN